MSLFNNNNYGVKYSELITIDITYYKVGILTIYDRISALREDVTYVKDVHLESTERSFHYSMSHAVATLIDNAQINEAINTIVNEVCYDHPYFITQQQSDNEYIVFFVKNVHTCGSESNNELTTGMKITFKQKESVNNVQ